MGRRGRRKTNKEYAIKLTHPEIGVFYFQYNVTSYNGYGYGSYDDNYYFTQTLSKVKTWKTYKYAEKEILEIQENLSKKKGKILLSLGKNISDDELKNKCACFRKRYYYPIYSILSKIHVKAAQDNIEQLSKTLKSNVYDMSDLINKLKINEKLIGLIEKLSDDIKTYKKDFEFLQKTKNQNTEHIHLDIVDASYGFRLLKLKTLKTLEFKDQEIDEENEEEIINNKEVNI